jgi:hypothetical protein
MCNLFTIYAEGDNIIEHLNKLQQLWDHIHFASDKDFKFADCMYCIIITTSLPPFWDQFSEPYLIGISGQDDPKKHISSQQMIGVLKQEYQRRQMRKRITDSKMNAANTGRASGAEEVNQTTQKKWQKQNKQKLSLASHIAPAEDDARKGKAKKNKDVYCRLCESSTHSLEDCRKVGVTVYGTCPCLSLLSCDRVSELPNGLPTSSSSSYPR